MGMAAFSFSTSFVAVATFDGCVRQGERLCSLMKAMPAINYLLQMCVCERVRVCKWRGKRFFRMDETNVWL